MTATLAALDRDTLIDVVDRLERRATELHVSYSGDGFGEPFVVGQDALVRDLRALADDLRTLPIAP